MGIGLLPALALAFFFGYGRFSATAWRAEERANVAGIGKGWMMQMAFSRVEVPPETPADVYAYAARLARLGLITDSSVWISKAEFQFAATQGFAWPEILVAGPDRVTAAINPGFQGAPLEFAVALLPSTGNDSLPARTPVVWTRGLQADGTWRPDSPFGSQGGAIYFAGGNVQQFGAIGLTNTPLRKWGTEQPIVNIAEALPPGIRWSEYQPGATDSPFLRGLAAAHLRLVFRFALGLMPLLVGVAGGSLIVSIRPDWKIDILAVIFTMVKFAAILGALAAGAIFWMRLLA